MSTIVQQKIFLKWTHVREVWGVKPAEFVGLAIGLGDGGTE